MNRTTPPENGQKVRQNDGEYNERVRDARREAIERKRELRRREMIKARIQLALIGAGIVAAIVVLIVVISLAVRSHRASQEKLSAADTESQTQSAALTETEAQTEPEPEETGPVSYAQTTDKTKKLTSAQIGSAHAIMIDLSSNTVLMAKEGDARIYPASMTKIMTLIVAYEHTENLEDTFTMTEDILGALWLENATVAGYSVGEQVRMDDLMYGLILPSGADCAVALAMKIAGSEEEFAKLMNEKVAELGLKGSHFKNPTGLHDDEQYSTCHDIALILEYALQNDFMRKVLSTYEYVSHPTAEHPEGVTIHSTMQERLYGDEAPGIFIVGGKTGYTTEAKNCLASFAVSYEKGIESEESVYEKTPEYIFVTAEGDGKWVPVFDAINAYALIKDENAMETKQLPRG